MADGKKQRSAKLVNLALNLIDTDCSYQDSSNRQVLNSTACDSTQKLTMKRRKSLPAQAQYTSESGLFDTGECTSTSQAHKKRARSISTHVQPVSNSESLNLSQGDDIFLSSISNVQNMIRQRARILSTHFECGTHPEPDNPFGHTGTANMCVTSSHLEQLKVSVPILHSKKYTPEFALRQFVISAVQFTSSSGPLRCWISQTEIINSKVIVMDIIENDNNLPQNLQQYCLVDVNSSLLAPINSETYMDETAKKSEEVEIEDKENVVPCSSKLSTIDSDTPRQSSFLTNNDLFSEPVLSGLTDTQEKPRRCVRTRGGKFGVSNIAKKIYSNIKEANIATTSEDEKPPNNRGKPCKRIRTRGGKSSNSTSNTQTKNMCIEDELTAIVGTLEHESSPKLSENVNLPISDEQLLQILEDSEENYEEMFDDDFLENMSSSDINSDTSIANEDDLTDLIPNNSTEENQEWSDHHRQARRMNFEGNPFGLKIQPEGADPIDYFNLIVTNELLDMIVDKSNENASRLIQQNLPGSRIKYWKDITTSEFKTFLGLLFHMGFIKLNRIQDYWKKHHLFNLTSFSRYMSRNRFLLILRVLHFENNNVDDTRLSKISLLVTYFNKRMKEIYFPSNNLCIDESLVLWRGRLIFRQYIKNKHNQYGIKLYVLTDVNGIVLKLIVYAGAGDITIGGTNHASKVVMNLLQDYVNKGYSVFMDNFYNSVELTEKLLSQKTYCTGTLRQNRKNNPKEVVTKKLKKGEFIAQYNKNGICVMKWRDTRDVLLISSEYDAQMVPTTTRRNTEKLKPNMVVNYNKNMGGVDHQDQMLAYYSCERKTLRWYKKLGIHMLQQMLYNSFTIYNLLSGTKKPLYDFLLAVIQSLLPDVNILTTSNTSTSTQIHVIQPCPRKGKSMRRRCKFCWESEKKRKDTGYYCPDCAEQPGFCIVNCFKLYHNY